MFLDYCLNFKHLFISVPLSMVFSLLFGFVWLLLLDSPPLHLQSQYTVGVCVMAVSCVIEMLCEAPVLVGNAFLFNKLKVRSLNSNLIFFLGEWLHVMCGEFMLMSTVVKKKKKIQRLMPCSETVNKYSF